MGADVPGGGAFRDCADVCPAMVLIPPGAFVMGSPLSEAGRSAAEGPAHRVTLAHGFAVSEFPITVGEFGRFVAETGYDAGVRCSTLRNGRVAPYDGRNWRNPDFPQTADHPVVCVNWNDARAYADWLSKKTRRAYRLLSEAEYEYVNRAGTISLYWWGDSAKAGCDHANGADLDLKPFGDLSWPYNDCHDGFAFTAPVGHFAPNPFGLRDTTGNVWSWTLDCWADSYDATPSDGSASTVGDCGLRVLRGGSLASDPGGLRSASRTKLSPAVRNSSIGFRVARGAQTPLALADPPQRLGRTP